ncbi:hypothetical protein BIW11_03303 [Tropilaelaps mercedesae]|uniref:Uncharacterized protein n=1 Tax=Tropilaelaps mercedesae TaxID=418985 RepID=A0A1V9XNS3_9ACAR|nr:hypothetical protein BIW11_03303 [Tropilaelaps mercedesae]
MSQPGSARQSQSDLAGINSAIETVHIVRPLKTYFVPIVLAISRGGRQNLLTNDITENEGKKAALVIDAFARNNRGLMGIFDQAIGKCNNINKT